MKSTPLKRKRAKPRARGTGCQVGKRCIAIGQFDGLRLCALHMADKMTGAFVKARDGECRRCGSPGPLDWAHVMPRSYRAVRWDPSNSVALCRPCHAWQTYHPIEGDQMFTSIGIDIDFLRMKAVSFAPEDPLEVIERLSSKERAV